MEQVTVVVDDSVGVLADVSYILGKSKINIESVSAASLAGKAVLSILVKDGRKARQVLEKNGYNVLESEILVIKLEDKPGELSKVTQLLKKENINILNLYFIARQDKKSILALRTDKYSKTKRILKPYLDLEG